MGHVTWTQLSAQHNGHLTQVSRQKPSKGQEPEATLWPGPVPTLFRPLSLLGHLLCCLYPVAAMPTVPASFSTFMGKVPPDKGSFWQ